MESTVLKRMGSRIRQLRKEAGYTLESLAEKVGLASGKYLGEIERGKNTSIETLERIAVALGVRVEDFFAKEEDELVVQIVDVIKELDKETKERILRGLKAVLE